MSNFESERTDNCTPHLIRAVASAPGKAILFGEHAVVYGTNAVAGALSDMRIFVETCVLVSSGESDDCSERHLEIHFQDIIDSATNRGHQISVPLNRIAMVVAPHEDPCAVQYPDATERAALDKEFHRLPSHIAQGTSSIGYLFGKIFSCAIHSTKECIPKIKGFRMMIKSRGLPLGAGLGSSAAFSVAAAASLLNLRAKVDEDSYFRSIFPAVSKRLASFLPKNNDSLDKGIDTDDGTGGGSARDFEDNALVIVNSWAYASEMLLHGAPSGLDNTTSCYGGLVKFKKSGTTEEDGKGDGNSAFSVISDCPPIHILLVNTKVPRSTKQLVSSVRTLYDAHTNIVSPIMDVINTITLNFCELLERMKSDDIEYEMFVQRMGEMVTMNHHLLCSLGVGHCSLTNVVEIAQSTGHHCKLTGAGGGGCAIILSSTGFPDEINDAALEENDKEYLKVDNLIYHLRSKGYDVHRTSIGGDGVHVYV